MTIPPAADITTLLSDKKLKQLRKAYDKEPDRMTELAQLLTVSSYPAGGAFIQGVITAVYGSGKGTANIAPRDREHAIIAALVADKDAGNLAVHVYWGLMVGLSVVDILNASLAAAAYRGVNAYRLAQTTMTTVLNALSALEDDLSPDACVAAVMGAMAK